MTKTEKVLTLFKMDRNSLQRRSHRAIV